MTNETTKDQALKQTAAVRTVKMTEPECSLKSLLATAPLDGIDLDRPAEKGRPVILGEVEE